MDVDRLVAGAEGETVTAGRLSEVVVEALAVEEQPHHLVQGKSLDVGTDESADRLYAAVDATAAAVATDRRLLFVVPEVVGVRTEAVPYDAIELVSVSVRTPKELRVESDAGDYCFNVSEDESPGTVGAFVEDRAARGPEPVVRGGTETGTGTGTDADATTARPTSDGGRSAGGRPEPTLADRSPDTPTDGGPVEREREKSTRGADAPGPDSGGVDDAAPPLGSTDDDPGSTDDESPAGAGSDPLDTLERLAELHDRGILDDEEFDRKKAELLDDL